LIPNILKVSSLNCEQLLTRASTLPQNETLHEKLGKNPQNPRFFSLEVFFFFADLATAKKHGLQDQIQNTPALSDLP